MSHKQKSCQQQSNSNFIHPVLISTRHLASNTLLKEYGMNFMSVRFRVVAFLWISSKFFASCVHCHMHTFNKY